MTKATIKMALGLVAGTLFASAASAQPIALTDTQMDSVAAGSFVCPVIVQENGSGLATASDNEGVPDFVGNSLPAEGEYTVAPPGASDLTVPMGATNGDGTGSPGGAHSAPGDTDYTAIWYQ